MRRCRKKVVGWVMLGWLFAQIVTVAHACPAATGLLYGPSLAIAADTPLTLAEAQRRAVDRSRQLAAQDSAISASREMAIAAGQLPDPVATVGVNNLPVNTSDAWSFTRD